MLARHAIAKAEHFRALLSSFECYWALTYNSEHFWALLNKLMILQENRALLSTPEHSWALLKAYIQIIGEIIELISEHFWIKYAEHFWAAAAQNCSNLLGISAIILSYKGVLRCALSAGRALMNGFEHIRAHVSTYEHLVAILERSASFAWESRYRALSSAQKWSNVLECAQMCSDVLQSALKGLRWRCLLPNFGYTGL